MLMPKTAVHEDNLVATSKNEIGRAWKIGAMKTIPRAQDGGWRGEQLTPVPCLSISRSALSQNALSGVASIFGVRRMAEQVLVVLSKPLKMGVHGPSNIFRISDDWIEPVAERHAGVKPLSGCASKNFILKALLVERGRRECYVILARIIQPPPLRSGGFC